MPHKRGFLRKTPGSMKPKKIISLALVILFLLGACTTFTACTYQGDEYTFKAPLGFKTKQLETQAAHQGEDAEALIFSQKGHLYFQVFRRPIPEDSDLKAVFNAYQDDISVLFDHYQLIAQNDIEWKGQPGIEYIHREFAGEPYVQVREIWVEHNGLAYSLVCTDPADATPGRDIPVAGQCYRLADNFAFISEK
jgi:hypothetical protein